jgi:hypothetical protein
LRVTGQNRAELLANYAKDCDVGGGLEVCAKMQDG